MKRMISLVLVLLALLACVPGAMGAQTIDGDARGELIIEYVHDKKPVTGALFCLYRVADVNASGYYTRCGDFAGYPVQVNGRENSQWRDLALTLEAFVRADGLQPAYVAQIDEYGFAVIEDLEPGLYLLLGDRFSNADGEYIATAAMAPIPAKQNADSDWFYSVTVLPKSEFQPREEVGKTSRKVIKIWDDKGNEASRPRELTVQLLCNGVVYDTVYLNKDNGWSYVWEDLAIGEDWVIVELVPEGYTVEIAQDGVLTTITNTNHNPPPPTEPEDESNQTGMLWWPVPVLALMGLVCVMAGVKLRRYEA